MLLHEFAHVRDHANGWSGSDLWAKAGASSPCVSDYARNDMQEDLAESVVA